MLRGQSATLDLFFFVQSIAGCLGKFARKEDRAIETKSQTNRNNNEDTARNEMY